MARVSSGPGVLGFGVKLLVALLALGFADAATFAQTNVTWNGGTGSWSNGANWSTNPVVPNNGGGNFYSAVINGTGSDTITFDATGTVINSLSLGSGESFQDNGFSPTLTIGDPNFPTPGLLTNNGTIQWGNSANLVLDITSGNGAITNNFGGSINLLGSTLTINDSGFGNSLTLSGSLGPFGQRGTIVLAGGTITGASGNETLIDANSVITGSGAISNLSLVNTGTIPGAISGIITADGGTLTINPGGSNRFTNNGAVQVTSGSRMVITGGGGLSNFDQSTGTLNGGSYQVAGTLQFEGAKILNLSSWINLSGPSALVTPDGATNALSSLASISSSGRLDVGNGATLTIAGSLASSGTIFDYDGGSLAITGSYGGSNAFFVQEKSTLTVGGDYNTNGGGTVLEGGSTLNVAGNFNGGITLAQNAFLGGNSATIGGALTPSGSGVRVDAGSLLTANSFTDLSSGTLTSSNLTLGGTFQYGGSAGNAITSLVGSSVVLDGPAALVTPDGATNGLSTLSNINNTSNLTVRNGSSLSTTATLSNSGVLCVGVILVSGSRGNCTTFDNPSAGSLMVAGLLTNQGVIVIAPLSTLTVSNGNNYTQGSLGSTTLDGILTARAVDIQGQLLLAGTVNGNLAIEQNAQESGQGTINGNVALNGGTFIGAGVKINGDLLVAGTLGNAITTGMLTVTGNYTQTAQGTLSEVLDGGSLFNYSAITGLADLGGTLDILTGFSPTSGETITILSAESISGQFSNIIGENLGGPSAYWSVVYTPTTVELVANTPEPGTLVMLSAGLLALCGRARRKTATGTVARHR